MQDSKLIRTASNQWTTINNVHYSYGWLGTNCQPTSNLALVTGKISLYDGKGCFQF